MTAYDDIELTTSDSYPIELYSFVGSFNSYYYTSFAVDHTLDGQLYTSIAGLRRKNIKITSVGGSASGDLEIEIPYDIALAAEYAFTDVPPELEMTLRRGHVSDVTEAFVVLWTGKVTSWTVKGRVASLKVPSTFAIALDRLIPSQRWQGPCSHLLYDARCGVSRAAFDHPTTLVSTEFNTITVGSLPWTGNMGNGGEVINNTTGERRTIISHSGTVVTLKIGFTQALPGHSLTLFQGCDHSAATCRDKFDNLDEYGGLNLVPSLNPFGSTLR